MDSIPSVPWDSPTTATPLRYSEHWKEHPLPNPERTLQTPMEYRVTRYWVERFSETLTSLDRQPPPDWSPDLLAAYRLSCEGERDLLARQLADYERRHPDDILGQELPHG